MALAYDPGVSNASANISLTREQSRRVDRLAVDRLGIPGVVLMENAGINATDVVTGMLEAVGGNKAAIVCGGGNNGGDGFVIARHLHNAGQTVVVYLAADPSKLAGEAAINFNICQAMGVKLMRVDDEASLAEQSPHWRSADVLVDAYWGTGFDATRGLSGQAARVITAINHASEPRRVGGGEPCPLVLALDVPSGLDCDTGAVSGAVIADATVTFVARKAGFDVPSAAFCLGEVFVAGIGVPAKLIDEAKQSV